MKKGKRRLLALALMLMLVLTGWIPVQESRADLEGVYFTAADEHLMELSRDTMPFWSGETLYVSSRLFEGTGLGVNYVRNDSMGLAVLYTPRTDLRFDLVNKTAFDKLGNTYEARAIERSGVVFFPLDMVCRFFGLTWSCTQAEPAPVIRVKSDRVILEDAGFVEAAAALMRSRYTAYEKWAKENPLPEGNPDVIQAVEGQKVFLVIDCIDRQNTLSVLEVMGEMQATFLLDLQQLADGELVRALIARGHQVALKISGETSEQIREEVSLGRELSWKAACSWLCLIWDEDGSERKDTYDDLGCVLIEPDLNREKTALNSNARAKALLTEIGGSREDLGIYLGADDDLGKLDVLLAGLQEGKYRVCGWRINS